MKAGNLLIAFLALAVHPLLSDEPGTSQRRIVFARESTLWTANLDGTKIRKLVKDGRHRQGWKDRFDLPSIGRPLGAPVSD
jgi:hypothetical protein